MQASSFGHSLLAMHSGLQFGGLPINSFKQAHDGELPTSLQMELGPHGDGSQGFTFSIGW